MASVPSRRHWLTLLPLAAFGLLAVQSASGAGPATPLGTWTGTSKCVDRTQYPACTDEAVVYRFTASPSGASSTVLTADKLVNGQPQTMGVMEFTFDPALHAWVSEFSNSRIHAVWTLVLNREGNGLTGTLVELPSRTLIRRISVTKRDVR